MDEEVDLIDICGTPDKHILFAENAVKYDKGLIIEKPIGIKLEDAIKFYHNVKNLHLPILVVYQYPFSETFSKLKEICNSGIYGNLKNFRVSYFTERDSKYYHGWTSKREIAGGGVLINQGIHFLNLIYSFIGYQNMKLFSTFGKIKHRYEVEDTIHISIVHDNGISGSFIFSTGLPSDLSIELFFEKAFVHTKGGEIDIFSNNKKTVSTPGKGTLQMLFEKYFNKIDIIPDYKMNLFEAVLDLKIIMSAYLSSSEKKIVEVSINNI